MNKIYIIKRFGFVDDQPIYYEVGGWWSQDLSGATIFTKVENAFVKLNELIEEGDVGITYRVMEINATEKCVELTTKLSTDFNTNEPDLDVTVLALQHTIEGFDYKPL